MWAPSRALRPSVLKFLRWSLKCEPNYARLSTKPEEVDQLWQDPWKHALPQQERTLTEFEEVDVDFTVVDRLLPPELIPEPPTSSEPTPSGWRAPQDPPPDLPYYIKRNRFHLPALYLSVKRDQLDPKTMKHTYKELVTLKGACEKDLKDYLETKLGHPVATFVNELQGRIVVCGADRSDLEHFVFKKGF